MVLHITNLNHFRISNISSSRKVSCRSQVRGEQSTDIHPWTLLWTRLARLSRILLLLKNNIDLIIYKNRFWNKFIQSPSYWNRNEQTLKENSNCYSKPYRYLQSGSLSTKNQSLSRLSTRNYYLTFEANFILNLTSDPNTNQLPHLFFLPISNPDHHQIIYKSKNLRLGQHPQSCPQTSAKKKNRSTHLLVSKYLTFCYNHQTLQTKILSRKIPTNQPLQLLQQSSGKNCFST